MGNESLAPSRPAAVALLLVLVVCTAWWGGLSPALHPPQVVPATAPAGEFSAARAREHLRVITEAPRPPGSAAHARTRDYLLETLRDMGLEPHVQQAVSIATWQSVIHAPVGNVVARIPGTAPGKAVVLAAHYDSVAHSPGANDAGNGVAAVLETTRALLAGPPLRNDVVVLVTDAEEVGLMGARAWVAEHPWAADTGVVLNAEGRGHGGPVYMFRAVGDNGGMIRVLARTTPWALADSSTDEMFRHLPNETDMRVFDDAGFLGMDFANARGFTHYHTALDSFEFADPRTLQQHGDYLLALARAFGDMDLSQLAEPRRVYFQAPLAGLVHYPVGWALPLAGGAALLLAWLVVALYRRGHWRVRGAAIAALHFAGALVLLPLLASLAWSLTARRVPELAWFHHGAPYDGHRYLLGLALLVVAVYVASLSWLRRHARPAEMLLPPLLAWLVLAVGSAALAPGTSYVFLWPLLAAMGGLALFHALRRPGARVAALALAAIPVLHIAVPMVVGLEEAMTLNELGAPMLTLALAVGLLAPQLDVASRPMGMAVPGVLLAAGVAILAFNVAGADFDEQRRKPNTLEYVADVGRGEAFWVSADPEPDAWTRHYLGPDPDRSPLPDWVPWQPSHAGLPWHRREDVLRTDAPDAEILEDAADGNARRLRLRITSPADAHVTVTGFPAGVQVAGLHIDGRPVADLPAAAGFDVVSYWPAADGIELSFAVPAGAPLELALRSNIIGLPAPAAGPAPARPAHTMPIGPWTERTRLQRTVHLP